MSIAAIINPPGGVVPDWQAVLATASKHAGAVDSEGRFPREAVTALREYGALGLMVPKALGGRGVGLRQIARMARELGGACASTAMVFAMHQNQLACLVEHHGDVPWQQDFLRRIAQRDLLLASVTSEEGIGGRIRTSRCAIEPTSSGRFRLVKEGSTVSYGAEADAYLLTTRRTLEADSGDQVLAVLPREACTVENYRGWDSLGMRGTGSGAFRIAGEGDVQQILGTSFGDIAARTMLPSAHILWSGVWLGIANDATARVRAFIRARLRAKPDPADPALARLAEMTGMLQDMDARVCRALDLYEAGYDESHAVEMMLLKTCVSETALEVVMLGMRVAGFAAYRNDSPYSLGRHLRDLHAAPLMVGNEAIRGDAGQLLLLHRSAIGDFGCVEGDL